MRDNFKTESRRTPKWDIEYFIWQDQSKRPGPEDVGKLMYIAGFKRSERYRLEKYHFEGEPLFPDSDACTCRSVRSDMKRIFYVDSVRIHPDEYKNKKKRRK